MDKPVIDEHQSVARAKAQWEAAIDALPQLVCLVDSRGKIMRANYTLEEWGVGKVTRVEGVGLHALLHPGCSDADCYLTQMMSRVSDPSPDAITRERVFDRQMGRHLRVQVTPFTTHPSGEHALQPLVMLVFEDISLRVEAERRAAEREQKLQLLVEFSSDMIIRFKCDGTLLYLSPASKALLDCPAEQLLGTDIYALIHADDRQAAYQNTHMMEMNGDIATVTCRLRCADDSYLWVEMNSQLVERKGCETEVVSIVRDIHARKRGDELAAEYRERLERAVNRKTRQLGLAVDLLKRKIEINESDKAALAASERRYTMLVENTLTGIYMREGTRLTFCNERFARIFGYLREEMCGMDLSHLGVPLNDDDIGEEMVRDESLAVVTRSGEEKWLKLSRARLDIGVDSFVLGNVIDITEQVHMNERLKASEHELRILSAQLLAAQENERKRIANELHDGIGQRLSAIKFAVEDVLRSEVDAGHVTQTERLGGIVARIRDTVEEIRRVSMDLRPSILDDLGLIATLGWFCREYCLIYKSIRVSKDVTVSEADIPDRLKVVVFRIAQEAMHNIAKHANADYVGIGLRQDDNGLFLSIRDNGKGFDYAQTVALGAGLGLKSMRERAELTGGRIAIESRPRHGAEITVLWPHA